MNDMLTFLAKLVKEHDLSTEEFIKESGLNKSQFYRGVKEPQKFSDFELVQMAKTLDLNDDQKSKLFSYKKMSDPEQEEINNWIKKILNANPYECNSESMYDFDYYEKYADTEKEDVYKWSEERLVKHIIEKFIKPETNKQFHHSIHVTIYNCCERSILLALSNFFLLLEKKVPENHTKSLRIAHFINSPEDENQKTTANKLKWFYTIMPLLTTCADYSFIERNLDYPIWNKNDNLCIIKYETRNKDNKERKYFLLNLNKKGKCHIASFDGDQKHLYDYYRIDARGLTFDRTSNNSSLKVNALIFESTINQKKILYHHDLCFDNIDNKYWNKVISSERMDLKYKEVLAKILDLRDVFSGFDADTKLRFGIDYLGKRYALNEKTGAINVLSSTGLVEFVEKQYISDLDIDVSIDGKVVKIGEYVKFNTTELINILKDINNRLGKCNEREERQEYYLLKPRVRVRGYSFCIFQDSNIWATSPESLHILDSASFYEDKEVVNVVYSFIITEIIGKQNSPESIIMTDDEARKYIDGIICKLENKME